jgi:SAM-dependent methyltransferase
MPKYGQPEYWDERYSDDNKPFDWLFDFKELRPLIELLLPDKEEQLFLIGCGNAPFSPHLTTKGKYTKVWNTDISPVVIAQQAAMYPRQRWEVMDVLHMPTIQNGSLPVVIDKSLIDTLLCYNDSEKLITKMIDELYRVLAPGSRFISFSLHPIEEVEDKYRRPDRYDWQTSFYHIKSNR